MLIWLNGAVGTMGSEHGILSAAEVQVLLDAQQASAQFRDRGMELIEDARHEAEAILAAAREQADRMLAEARASIEEAHSRAYEQATRQAVLDWHEKKAGEAVANARSLRAVHEKLAQVVATAVERIVGTESRSGLYQRALRSVRTLTRGATTLTLRVSPGDAEQAQASIGELAEMPSGLNVEVAVDPGLRPGACIFESELGVLDASLETQLDGLRMAMERAVRSIVAHGEPAGDARPGFEEDGGERAEAHADGYGGGYGMADDEEADE